MRLTFLAGLLIALALFNISAGTVAADAWSLLLLALATVALFCGAHRERPS